MAKSFQQLAQLAYDNELYVPSWSMEILYHMIIEDDHNKELKIALHFKNKIPVAAVILDLRENFISVFVKPEFRGQGIGSLIVNKIIKKYKKKPENIVAGEGDNNSMSFYKSLGIFCVKYDDLLLEAAFTPEEKQQLVNLSIADIMQARIDAEKKRIEQYYYQEKSNPIETKNDNNVNLESLQ